MSSPAPVVVVDYDPQWPRHFEAIRDRLWPAVCDLAVSIMLCVRSATIIAVISASLGERRLAHRRAKFAIIFTFACRGVRR